MRIDEVVTRLSTPRAGLPAWPSVLDPVVRSLDRRGVTGRGRRPAPGTSAPPWERTGPVGAREAAALVLMYPGVDGEAHLVLTVRPSGDHVHAGQVALPGGKREPGDAFPEGTALREATEEIGLDASLAGVRTLGLLDVVDVRVSGFLMTPVLAVATTEPVVRPDGHEVAEVLRVPVRRFLPGAPIAIVEETRDGWPLRYGAYEVGRHRVWGATARVLGQLGAILGDVTRTGVPGPGG